jgi:hypothetical protein
LLFIDGLGAKEGKMVIPFFTWVHVAKMQLKNSNPSTIVVPFSSLASRCQKTYFEKLILMKYIYNSTKNKKISTCSSSPMLCANIFHHNTSFDPKTSPTRNMALTIGLPLGIEDHGLFFRFIAYTK